MTQITGGRIMYGRTVQPAQYESKKAEVEFAFAVEDGAYDVADLDKIIHAAIEKANGIVGIASSVKVGKATVAADLKADAEKIKAKGKTKADLENEKALELAQKAASKDVVIDVLDLTANEEVKPKPDDLGDILGTTATATTDKDLIDAVNNKNKAINNPKAIKAVCLKYTKQAIKDIPAEKREEFLKELSALT